MGIGCSGLAAYVFHDDESSPEISLNAFVTAAAKNSGNVFDLRREIKSRLHDAGVGAAFRSEKQAMGERIPGRAVNCRQGIAVDVFRCHEGDAVGGISVN